MIRVLLAVAARGDAVIVGRGAGFLLPAESTVHVRVIAPFERRVAYFAQSLRLSREEAAAEVRARDERRAEFLEANAQPRPRRPDRLRPGRERRPPRPGGCRPVHRLGDPHQANVRRDPVRGRFRPRGTVMSAIRRVPAHRPAACTASGRGAWVGSWRSRDGLSRIRVDRLRRRPRPGPTDRPRPWRTDRGGCLGQSTGPARPGPVAFLRRPFSRSRHRYRSRRGRTWREATDPDQRRRRHSSIARPRLPDGDSRTPQARRADAWRSLSSGTAIARPYSPKLLALHAATYTSVSMRR